jgi:hypothetical protein
MEWREAKAAYQANALAIWFKPKKLKVAKTRLNILNELRSEGREIEKLMAKTVATWQGETPKFESLIGLIGKDATVVVGPTGSDKAVNKWVWADQGTKAHVIRAKNKPRLLFRTGFTPKTKPNIISSFRGSKSGPWTSPVQVNHPGTAPRNFSKTIVSRRRKKFINRIVIAARPVT